MDVTISVRSWILVIEGVCIPASGERQIQTASSLQIWQLLSRNTEGDRTAFPRHSCDESPFLQRQDYLVHGRRTHGEVPLHIRLSRWLAVDLRVEVNERQILPLLLGELWMCHVLAVTPAP